MSKSTSTTAATATTAPNKQSSSKKQASSSTVKQATNTNTDVLCCDDGFLAKAMYRYNLWTGLYMLEQDERLFFHIFGWMFVFSLSLYMGVFLHGFVDGLLQ
mmetsp:Transcript_3463/g.5782  ORF Transcript_3463/g.5782 Transcript_3463/m.5782 type:complete len:102 (-) Transcript_3463:188-493(-)